MSHPKPYPRCVFCDARADSREHAVPKWIGRRLGIKEFLPGGGLGRAPRKQPVSFRSYRARIFCKACNAHFKHLEDEVIPLLEPMAKGRALALNPDSQAVLALWASKTAIALIAANNVENPPDATVEVPADHRASVREHGRPSDAVWVGYVPWQGTAIISTGEAVVHDREGRDTPFDSYVVVLAFAKVAFKVTGFMEPLPATQVIEGNVSSISQFWPPMHQMLVWPAPGPPGTNDTLGALLNFLPLRRIEPPSSS